MNNWRTKNGYEIFRVLLGRSNAYLIRKGSTSILIDTGKKSSFRTLLRNLDSLDISINDISFLILTHTHYDHCQSAKEIKEKSKCQVVVSGNSAASIIRGYTLLPRGTIPFTKLIARLGLLIGDRKFGYEPFPADIFVKNECKLNKDTLKLKLIETPGHSADSVSIIVDNEIAVVGDTMFGIFRNSVFPPYADDIAQMVESWGKLLRTDCSVFLPGHGKEIGRELLQKEFKKHFRKR